MLEGSLIKITGSIIFEHENLMIFQSVLKFKREKRFNLDCGSTLTLKSVTDKNISRGEKKPLYCFSTVHTLTTATSASSLAW